jgi:triacylglycerol lipase
MSNERKDLPKVTLENARPPYNDYDYFANSTQHPFRHEAKKFEMINAWWLCEAATLVYSAPDFVESTFKEKAGLPNVVGFSNKGTECFVASNDRFAIVAFRGTEIRARPGERMDFGNVFRDLVTDFTFRPISSGVGGKVHEGFKQAIDKIWDEQPDGLSLYLSHLNDDGCARPIWLTGHSLGAAMATLAAVKFDHLQGIYTYGSPRVGDDDFAAGFRRLVNERFGIEYYRFVNDRDVVTTVPPQVGYHNIGALKHITSSGEVRDNPTIIERIKQRLHGLFTMPFDNLGRLKPSVLNLIPEGLEDHVPLFYSVHIWNAYLKELQH